MKLVRKFKVEYDGDGRMSASSRYTIVMRIHHEYFIDNEDYLWVDEDCPNGRLSPGVSIVERDVSYYHVKVDKSLFI